MYTVWINYGIEGWSPRDFNTEKEVTEFIIRNEFCSRGLRITKELSLFIND